MQSSITDNNRSGFRRSSAPRFYNNNIRNNSKQSWPAGIRTSMDDDFVEQKLSSSAGALQIKADKERRNSVHSFFAGRSNVPRGSVPAIPVTQSKLLLPRQASLQTPAQTSIYKSFKQYLKGDQAASSSSSAGNEQQLSKLDETFAQIKSQLSELTSENRGVRERVHSLTEAVTELCSYYYPVDDCTTDDSEELLQINLPIGRVSSHPPFLNGWEETDVDYYYCSNSEDLEDQQQLGFEWLDKIQPEVDLVGVQNARVPCIILIDEDSGSDVQENETDDGNKEHENFENCTQNSDNNDEVFSNS